MIAIDHKPRYLAKAAFDISQVVNVQVFAIGKNSRKVHVRNNIGAVACGSELQWGAHCSVGVHEKLVNRLINLGVSIKRKLCLKVVS